MTALIFGANGQDGHYLHALLKKLDIHVIGISRKGPWRKGDVTDWNFVKALSTLR